MGCLNTTLSKCEFAIYKGVSEHKCEKTKWKYHTFYQGKTSSGNKTDRLNVVESPKNYTKRRIRIQTDCNCEKTVRLSISKQLAKSFYYNPGMVYNYTDKIEINTDLGFIFWVFRNTYEIRSKSKYVDGFIGSLMPGTTFYEGSYLKQISDECSPIPTYFQNHAHGQKFVKLLELASDLSNSDIVVNKIIPPQ